MCLGLRIGQPAIDFAKDQTCLIGVVINADYDVPHPSKDRQINNCRISEGDSPIFVERKLGQSPTY